MRRRKSGKASPGSLTWSPRCWRSQPCLVPVGGIEPACATASPDAPSQTANITITNAMRTTAPKQLCFAPQPYAGYHRRYQNLHLLKAEFLLLSMGCKRAQMAPPTSTICMACRGRKKPDLPSMEFRLFVPARRAGRVAHNRDDTSTLQPHPATARRICHESCSHDFRTPYRPRRNPSHPRRGTGHRAPGTATLEALLACKAGSTSARPTPSMHCRPLAWPGNRVAPSSRRTSRSPCSAVPSPVPM